MAFFSYINGGGILTTETSPGMILQVYNSDHYQRWSSTATGSWGQGSGVSVNESSLFGRFQYSIPRHLSPYSQMMSKGCPITETKRSPYSSSMLPFSVSVSQDPPRERISESTIQSWVCPRFDRNFVVEVKAQDCLLKAKMTCTMF